MNKQTLAEWWCALNCWRWPDGAAFNLGRNAPDQASAIRGAFSVVNALAGDDGLRLWQDRLDAGVNVANGLPFPSPV